MKDWKSMAKASGAALSQEEMERVAGAMEALEANFRKMTGELSPDLEPAVQFSVEEPE